MTRGAVRPLMGVVAAMGVLSLALGSVAGPTPLVSFVGVAEASGEGAQVPARPGAYVPPRTPDGQPDIQGMWLPGGLGLPMERASGGEKPPAADEYAEAGRGGAGRAGGAPETGGGGRGGGAGQKPTMVVDPADGKVPLQPWAVARRAEIIANQDKIEFLDPRVRCLPPGIPRVNLPITFNTYQIQQIPGHVVFVYEWSHHYRVIPLDGRPHIDPKIRLWMGDPRGRWEGNTLVVDSTNFTDRTWALGHGAPPVGVPASALTGGQGVFHSEALHVVERFTPVDANTIAYEVTIEDPKVFTRPFKVAWNAFLRAPKEHQLYEYACFEGDTDTVLRMTGFDIDPTINVGR